MSFEFDVPEVVSPDGVDAAARPRPVNIGSDEARRSNVRATTGAPLTHFEGTSNPYIDYESIDLLLSLQHPRSDGYDEMCFIIMGQAKELLFKGLHFELHNARARIQADDVGNARLLLTRSRKIIGLISEFWEVLSTITPDGFNRFRDYLDVASGQQSFMYRHVEFILGNKSRDLCAVHQNVPHVYPALEASLQSPSLYDEVIRLLNRRGHALPTECLDRDWSETYTADPNVEEAWLEVYGSPTPDNDLFLLGEDLLNLADVLMQYRWRHAVTVERIIGSKPGTGGSSGVTWLRRVLDHRFFPELWSVRDRM